MGEWPRMDRTSLMCASLADMPTRTLEEHRWLQALENASFGLWDLDPRRESVHYSPSWKARLGFPRIHAPDSTAFWRCRVHPDDFGPMLGSLRSHLDGHADSYLMRFRLRSNGSGYRTMLSRGRVVSRDERGHATRMVGTMVDVTGRPAVVAPYGLATEEPCQTSEARGSSLHAVLADERSAGSSEMSRLIEQIDDLLDIALRDSGATP